MSSSKGGMVCSVATCKSRSNRAEDIREHVMFFTFPKDHQIKKQWAEKCSRNKAFSPHNKRICSKHFKEDDYEDEMMARLMGIPPKKIKKTAIPSLHLLVTEHEETYEQKNLAENWEKKVFVENFQTSTVSEVNTQENALIDSENVLVSVKSEQLLPIEPLSVITEATPDLKDLVIVKLKKQLQELQASKTAECDILNMKLRYVQESLSKKHRLECTLFQTKLKRLQKENDTLKQKLLKVENNFVVCEKQLKEARVKFEEKVKIAFKDFLTSNQVEIALKNKTKARWTPEELSRAFTIRYFSKRCYLYLKDKLHYPLPGISTLQEWAAHTDMRNEALKDILNDELSGIDEN